MGSKKDKWDHLREAAKNPISGQQGPPPIRVMVGVVSRDKPDWEAAFGIMAALKEAEKAGIMTQLLVRKQEALVDRGRNNMLFDFMRSSMTHLLTIDDDVAIPPDAIIRLVAADKDVVAGVYRLKNHTKIKAAIRLKVADDERDLLAANLLMPAVYVSTGCMMVKRRVFEDMIKRYPDLMHDRLEDAPCWALYMPFIYRDETGFREYLSEDWAFCRRALDVGHEVWVDGGVKCAHFGIIPYTFPNDTKNQVNYAPA